MKYCFIDVETTGKDPVKQDIIEVAGIIYENENKLREFYFQCQPFDYNAIESEAVDVHGITVQKMKTFMEPEEACHKLNKILYEYYTGPEDRYILVAHNVSFDKGFLFNWFIKCQKFDMERFFCRYREVCTYRLAMALKALGYMDGKKNSLRAVCKELGVELEGAHQAQNDIRATAKAFWKMVERMRNTTTAQNVQQLTLF